MTEKEMKRLSRFLSLVLRHKPETIGLNLDQNGWADTEELLKKVGYRGFPLNLEQLMAIVETNDKMRFSFSDDFKKIRANQGHSLKVDLQLKEEIPPELLYHGTSAQNLSSIKENGIQKGQRHHVHFSIDEATAQKVGSRHGKPVVLEINAKQMHAQGIKFYRSENGIWLTDYVPPEFIDFPLS